MRHLNRIAGIFVFAALILLATSARAGDDTARFYGTWKATVSIGGQSVTIVSVHDAQGFHNVVQAPTGDIPAGDGTYSAVDGKWSSDAPYPNNGGTYRFVDKDTVTGTNAAGQAVTWIRVKPAAASAPPPTPSPTPVDPNTYANRTTGYVPPSGRPGASTTPPVTQPSKPGALTSSGLESPNDAKLSPNVKAGFGALNAGDRVTAWRDFIADAQKGNSDAETAVGSMLFNNINPPGTGFYKDCEKWLLAAAKQNNPNGMDMLGLYYFNDAKNMAGGINPGVNNAPLSPQGQQIADAKFAQARQWFEKSAALNNFYAMGHLAIMLDGGVGGPRDPNRAAQLRAQVQKGPDQTYAGAITKDPASLAMAASWQSGHYADALKTAQANAAKGDANAESLLGRAYYEGVGVPQSYATALVWLNKAVAQNNDDAMFFLGLMYEHGRGVQQNLDKALNLFDQAAGLGQGRAKMEAAGMRQQGEINRLTARSRGSYVETNLSDEACRTSGGDPGSGVCVKDGVRVDPFDADSQAGYVESAPEPEYEPEPEQ